MTTLPVPTRVDPHRMVQARLNLVTLAGGADAWVRDMRIGEELAVENGQVGPELDARRVTLLRVKAR